MSDDPFDGPEGYRIPGRVRPDEATPIEYLDEHAEDSPAIRLANLLLLGALDPEGTLVRVEPISSASPVSRKVPGGSWEVAMDGSAETNGILSRRYKVMAALPAHVMKEPTMGFIRLLVGQGREVDFCVFVRPCPGGERVILRHVPEKTRRAILGAAPARDAASGPLRWKAEHAFRLARGAVPSSAIGALADLHEAAVAAGSPAVDLQLRSASLLGSLLFDAGDFEGAVTAFAAGRRAAEEDRGEGPAAAEFMRHGALALARLGRMDEAVRLGLEAVAVARRVLVADPLVADLLCAVGGILRDAGRATEARAAYDEAIAELTEISGADDSAIGPIREQRDATSTHD